MFIMMIPRHVLGKIMPRYEIDTNASSNYVHTDLMEFFQDHYNYVKPMSLEGKSQESNLSLAFQEW